MTTAIISYAGLLDRLPGPSPARTPQRLRTGLDDPDHGVRSRPWDRFDPEY